MAQYRLAGPTCGAQQTLFTQDGTLQRAPAALPGALVAVQAGAASGLDPLVLWRRAACVQEAAALGAREAPAAILRETGYQLQSLIEGLLPGLLMMMAVVGASAALGGAIGAAVGALAGGVGAVPGAAAGATLGTDVGIAVLAWLGLGFLAAAIGRGLGEVSGMVMQAVRLAWDAHGTPRRDADVQAAGRLMADAVARLMMLILMAIVARLTMGQATGASARAAGSADELIAALRSSRLGAGFADWVAANAQSLLRNPRLRPQSGGSGGAAGGSATSTPSQLRPAAPPPPAPAPTPAPRRGRPAAKRAHALHGSHAGQGLGHRPAGAGPHADRRHAARQPDHRQAGDPGQRRQLATAGQGRHDACGRQGRGHAMEPAPAPVRRQVAGGARVHAEPR
ncbi:DUF6861 domain-containing protein [Aquincola sp. J276]|uniref:DUF6861 domain-containing protein n=1 Tax=Aquincola sp. J276 TaxID=2898432 RepID=UPI00385798B0